MIICFIWLKISHHKVWKLCYQWFILHVLWVLTLLTRERTCSPVSTWNANVVTFVPADVLKRKYNLRWDIASRNADPEYRIIYTKNIYMNTILNIDLSFEQHSLKLHMRSRTGRVYSAFERFDNHSSWSQLYSCFICTGGGLDNLSYVV